MFPRLNLAKVIVKDPDFVYLASPWPLKDSTRGKMSTTLMMNKVMASLLMNYKYKYMPRPYSFSYSLLPHIYRSS